MKYYLIPNGWWQDDGLSQSEVVKYDYAILGLWDEDFHNGWQGFASKSYGNLKNTSAWTAGWPRWFATCDDSPRADLACYDYLYADDCNIDKVTSSSLKNKCDAVPGQSGSPLYHFNGGSRQVVGIMSKEDSETNYASRIRDSVFDTLCDAIGDYPTENHEHDCY